jgi:hypothetical protein
MYIVWFLPLVFIAVLGVSAREADESLEGAHAPDLDEVDPPPVLAGAA